MAPSSELDGAMGPPSGSGSISSGQATQLQQGSPETYNPLKRRFLEVAEGTVLEGHRTDERNVKVREEEDHLQAGINEIERHYGGNPNGVPTDATSGRESKVKKGQNGHQRKASGSNTSPRVRAGASNATTASASRRNDVEMADGTGKGSLQSRTSDDQPTTPRSNQAATPRRSMRNAGSSGSAIAAVAAAAAEAEAAITSEPPSSQPSPLSNGIASKLQNAEATLPSIPNPTSSHLSTFNGAAAPYANFAQSAAMESIVKVAEAAIAAQQAAKLAAAQPSGNVDPNLDPSLFSGSDSTHSTSDTSLSGAITNNAPNAPSKPPVVTTIPTTNGNSTVGTSSTPTSATSSSSNLSNNPYLALTRPGANTPSAHAMIVPYPLFYPPPPGTSVTPGAATYSVPYNPYYFLATPMPQGANGMFPPPPGFTLPPPPPPQQQQQQRPPPEPQRVGKPKRQKAHSVTTKSFSIPMVPRDKNGKPMLPLNVGIMTVISLGDVCMREHFHSERYIFPVGYEVTRRYLSTVDANVEVVYHCTILDGGDGPKFQIIPADRLDKPVIAGTATGAWSNIVKQANAIRNRQHSNSVSGPDFFGLGQNTIKHLIQELPNADKLRDYVWQNFVEGGPLGGRHAAVIPALPEEYDTSMPIGAYFPRRNEAPNPNLPSGLSYYPPHVVAQAEAQKAQREAAAISASSSAPVLGPSGLQPHPQPSGQQMSAASAGGGAGLTIQEYQPPTQSISVPPANTQNQKRATRSNTAARAFVNGAVNVRHTRSASKGNPQQQQTAAGPSVSNTEGAPMTFAGIMSAYPIPGAGNPNATPTAAEATS